MKNHRWPRGFARPGFGNNRGDGPAFAALRRLRLRNWPPPLEKPNQSETPSLDFTACRLRFPHETMELAVIPLRSSGGDSEKLAPRYRDGARKRSDPVKLLMRLRSGIGMAECFRDIHPTHFVDDPSDIYSYGQGTPRP